MAVRNLTLNVPGRFRCIDLLRVVGVDLLSMPWVHRILLENILRHQDESTIEGAKASFIAWLKEGRSEDEIQFVPNRILMHDTTCGPALTDIAAMRDVMAAAGLDPMLLNPVLPIATSTDHSVAVDFFRGKGMLARNMAREIQRNSERYRFMKWASQSIDGFRVFPPGSGIMHTINMERLATVTASAPLQNGNQLCFPDTLVGTDSHTPMVNAMGVLAWGVGGIEAEGLMFGVPISIRIPEVIGVYLTGTLPEGVMATDLALHLTHRLRKIEVVGEFVEYFGPGVSSLTVGQRSVVANMAPEYGATTGFFPIDQQTLSYLQLTGRSDIHISLVAAQSSAQHLWFDPMVSPRYSRRLEVDLSALRPSLAGPKRPQDLLETSMVRPALAAALAGVTEGKLPRDALAIAAITSCTNTTDPALLVAAGLVARNARRRGLSTPPWVKTSLTPGSPATAARLKRVGLMVDLEALGFVIAAYGCATCIGNSGPLSEPIAEAIEHQGLRPVAVLSGNRNFPGRVHNQVDDAILASPALVVAYALAGRTAIDIAVDPLGIDPDGRPVTLRDLWPSADEVQEVTRRAWDPLDVDLTYGEAEASQMWNELSAPRTPLFPWDATSTYLRPPPFVGFADSSEPAQLLALHPIMVVGDDVTTDHISPAGAIPRDSDAGRWLIEQGENPDDLNVYSSRRGNWEVMVRGLFSNRNIRNLIGNDLRGGESEFATTGERLQVWQIAERHRQAGQSVCIVAGERYGAGSSRDWAAKGIKLLGAKVLFANSMERIHRSNLIGMGVLPLTLPLGWRPETLGLSPGDRFEIEWHPDRWGPRAIIATTLRRADGSAQHGDCIALIETKGETDLLRAGGMIASILARNIIRPADRPKAQPGV